MTFIEHPRSFSLWRGLRIGLLVVVCWILLPVGLAEVLFRWVESSFLQVRTLSPEEHVFDLANLGYNDARLLPPQRPEDSFRILSLGDSFAYSIVQPSFTYAAVLEEQLAEALDRNVQVVNLGRPSVSFASYLQELETWTSLLEYDGIVINIYSGNDFREAAVSSRAWPGGIREEQPVTLHELPGPAARIPRKFSLRLADYGYAFWQSRYQVQGEDVYLSHLEMRREIYLGIMQKLLGVQRPDRYRRLKQSYLLLHELLLRIASLEEQGVRTLIVVSPPHFTVDDDLRADVLARASLQEEDLDSDLPIHLVREISRQAGVGAPVLDLRDVLREAQAEGVEVYYSTNTHWSKEGNAVVGKALSEYLVTHWFRGDPSPSEDAPVAISAWLSRVLRTQRDRSPIVRRLRQQRFATLKELTTWLEHQGFHPDPNLIGTLIGGKRAQPGQLLGGWAWDRRSSSPLEVLVFYEGVLVGSSRVRFPGGSDLYEHFEQRGFEIPPENLETGFVIRVSPACRHLSPGGEAWSLALTRDRRFARIAVRPDFSCGGHESESRGEEVSQKGLTTLP